MNMTFNPNLQCPIIDMDPQAWHHLVTDVKKFEGYRSKAYLDTVGVWTIGFGETAGVKKGDTITLEEATRRLTWRLAVAVEDARALLGYDEFNSLNGPRQAIVANLAYNLGRSRLSKFVNTLDAIRKGEWERAAKQMRASKWCMQVKRRCPPMVESMRRGEYIVHK